MQAVATGGLSDHALAVFKARWDGTRLTAQTLAAELGMPAFRAFEIARALSLPNAIQPRGGSNAAQLAKHAERQQLAGEMDDEDPAAALFSADIIAKAEEPMPEPTRFTANRVTPEGETLRRCTGPCGRELPLSMFYPHHRSLDGISRQCKDCQFKHGPVAQAQARERELEQHLAGHVEPSQQAPAPMPPSAEPGQNDGHDEAPEVLTEDYDILYSLLQRLPPEALWTAQTRDAWVKAFLALLDLLVSVEE